jgi:hypothetical protein
MLDSTSAAQALVFVWLFACRGCRYQQDSNLQPESLPAQRQNPRRVM